ncbi:MAG: hypothetical protein ACI9U2_003475 [Bradymonadia bacterium]|jgi:hypothetical protein
MAPRAKDEPLPPPTPDRAEQPQHANRDRPITEAGEKRRGMDRGYICDGEPWAGFKCAAPGAHATGRVDRGREPETRRADERESTLDGPKRSHLRVDGIDAAPVRARQGHDAYAAGAVGFGEAGEVEVVADRPAQACGVALHDLCGGGPRDGRLAGDWEALSIGMLEGAIGAKPDVAVLVAQRLGVDGADATPGSDPDT